MPDFCNYIPRPLISFDLDSYRRRKSEEDEWQIDQNRIIVFDREDFYKEYRDGDRIRVIGEIQSRNYTRDTYEVDEILTMAVRNYVDIWDKYPCAKKPKGNARQLVEWDKLIEFGLIPDIPEDSIFKAGGVKDREGTYVYRVNEDGELFKETQHVRYEVIAKEITLLEEDFDELDGDKNKAVVCGRITKQPYFDMIGGENQIAFCSFNVAMKSEVFEDRTFYVNVITWAKVAQTVFEGFVKDDYIKVIGRLQSRTFQKEFVKRWKTPSGKRKKKAKIFDLVTHEVSATKVSKVEVEPKENKNQD